MIKEDKTEGNSSEVTTSFDVLKKILVWFIVFCIVSMLIIILVFQPRFYTFVHNTIFIDNFFIITHFLM